MKLCIQGSQVKNNHTSQTFVRLNILQNTPILLQINQRKLNFLLVLSHHDSGIIRQCLLTVTTDRLHLWARTVHLVKRSGVILSGIEHHRNILSFGFLHHLKSSLLSCSFTSPPQLWFSLLSKFQGNLILSRQVIMPALIQ